MEELAPDVFAVKVWTPEECAWLIDEVSAQPFTPLVPNDVYKTDDVKLYPSTEPHIVRLHEMLFTMLYGLKAQIENTWRCLVYLNTECTHSFVHKQSVSAIPDLAEHRDSGDITVLVKLNTGYEGNVTVFPRQGINNTGIEPGTALIFPGGGPTHPHYVTPITSGEKYASVTWLTVGTPTD